MRRVFLVDAFRDESEMYAKYLGVNGCEVITFDSPVAALDAARTCPPDVIVARTTPHGGVQPVQELIVDLGSDDRTDHVPVVLLTTSSFDHAPSVIGCDAYLLLPATPSELLEVIRFVLGAPTDPKRAD